MGIGTARPRPARTSAAATLAAAAAAAALAATLAGCSSAAPPPPTAASLRAVCLHHPVRVQTQPPQASAAPGRVLWSVLLNRCQGAPAGTWGSGHPLSVTTEGILAPGGRLLLMQDGTIGMYDASTGARLWQRTLASPSGQPAVDDLEVSAAWVLVSFQSLRSSPREVLLDAGTGRPAGPESDIPAGDPFLVGSHVVVSNKNQLEGYDPAANRILWRVTVANAPAAAGALDDDSSTLYLSSVAPSGDEDTMFQRHILRLDVATGHWLAPLPLPGRLNIDPEEEGGNAFAQGLLVLEVDGTKSTENSSGQIGTSVTQTLALNPQTGRVAWNYPGSIDASTAGTFAVTSTDDSYTALAPQTGKIPWTISATSLNELGAQPLAGQPGFLVATGYGPGGNGGVLLGVRPKADGTGAKLWASSPLPGPQAIASNDSTVFVTTCQQDSNVGLCADSALVAVAT
jgi:outer membrane protein assembly factor BamB